MSRASDWRQRVEAHNVQTMRARGARDVPDLWSGLAGGFQDDPRRTGDPIIDLVGGWLTPQSTVLDVGGGAGRHALPFALRCKHATIVEPSQAMQSALAESAKASGIENYSVVGDSWEDAKVEPADVVFCAHVVYATADIDGFVRKLIDSSRDYVAIVLGTHAPLSRFSPIWKAVHQEERIDLPAMPDLLPVLWEMGVYPNVTMAPAGTALTTVPNLDVAVQFARHFLYVAPDSDEDRRLQAAVPSMLEETPNGFTMRDYEPPRQAVIWWRSPNVAAGLLDLPVSGTTPDVPRADDLARGRG